MPSCRACTTWWKPNAAGCPRSPRAASPGWHVTSTPWSRRSTELTEKVDNALQVTEDVYLARVYSAALDLFRVSTVSAAVDRKLAIIRDTYSALYDEASSSRAELLEVLIVLLIVVEIALAVIRP